MVPEQKNGPVMGITDEPAPPKHAWERLLWVCHGGFYLSLVIVTALVLGQSNQTWGERGLLLGLTLGVAGWFAAGSTRGMFELHPLPSESRHLPSKVAYLAVGWSLVGVLLVSNAAYTIVSLALLWHLMGIVPVRWAVPGYLAFAAPLTWVSVGQQEGLAAWALAIGLPVVGVLILFLWIFAVMSQSAQRQRLIEELEAARGQLATSERQAGVLEERQRLAREIHDTLAQGFTSIVMHHEAAETALPDIPVTARKHLDQARQTARESLAEARRLVWALTPQELDRASLPEAMDQVAQRWSEPGKKVATVTVTGGVRPLHPSVEVTLLRATQEALSNAQRHAEATKVNVTISYMDDEVVLDVQDDGVGFDPDRDGKQLSDGSAGGFGLVAMRQRVEQLGGTLLIESTPGRGTTLVANLPITV